MNKTISIFLPRTLLRSSSGWLIGYWVVEPRPAVYVLAVLHDGSSTNKILFKKCQRVESENELKISVIGELFNNDLDRISKESSQLLRQVSEIYVELHVESYKFLMKNLRIEKRQIDLEKECLMFLYDPELFMKSKLLTFEEKKFGECNCSEKLMSVIHQWQKLGIGKSSELTPAIDDECEKFNFHPENKCNVWGFPGFLSLSSFICQSWQRFKQLQMMISTNPKVTHMSCCLRCQNTLSSIAFDMLLGYLFLCQLRNWISNKELFDLFMFSAETAVDRVDSLIRWLMGVPAGLKLNFPLSSALGRFFLYHIYLWKTYIYMVQPVLQAILLAIFSLGWLGFTFQLSLLVDLISLATFHIYCFYVYAARVYHIHITALISLWRLVRGRKWNPLRQRVDSSKYNLDQLFIGSLFFMILLFLFPTTLLFYIVFCCLRLTVLTVVGVINRLVLFISTLPSFAVLLHLAGSKFVSYDIRLAVEDPVSVPLLLKLQVVTSSLKNVWTSTLPFNFIPKTDPELGDLLRDLLIGNLIYPM